MAKLDFDLLQDLLQKEFAYGGRGPQFYDCYGLCKEIYRRIGIYLPDFTSYTEPSLIHAAIIEGKKLFQEISEPEPFCLVTFFIRPKYTTHIGVVLEDMSRFIHIMEHSNVTIERLRGWPWEKRITGFFTWQK